jgi:hypothetical protein
MNINNNENVNPLIQNVYTNYINHVSNNNRLLSNTIDIIRNQNDVYNYIVRYYITSLYNTQPDTINSTTPTSQMGPTGPTGPTSPISQMGPTDSFGPTFPIYSNDRNLPVTITSDVFLSTIYNNILNSNYELENNNNNNNNNNNLFIESLYRNRNRNRNRNSNRNNATLPTINDLLLATTYNTYGEIDNPINETCPISQKDFSNNDIVLIINECKHIFEPNSIMKWFTRCSDCPLCRRSIIHTEEAEDMENNEDTENNEDIENNESNYSIITRHLAYIISNDISYN